MEILQVDPSLVAVANGVEIDMPCVAYVGVAYGEIVGSGGLAWGRGKCWIWLSVNSSDPSYALPIFHKTKALLKKARQLGETDVFTPRDAHYPTSKKLLTLMGFQLHEVVDGIEIWRISLIDSQAVA